MMMGELNPSENTVRIIKHVRNMFNLFSDIFVIECPNMSGFDHPITQQFTLMGFLLCQLHLHVQAGSHGNVLF